MTERMASDAMCPRFACWSLSRNGRFDPSVNEAALSQKSLALLESDFGHFLTDS